MDDLRMLRQSLTEGVADWLIRLVDSMPGLAPPRADPTEEDPAVAGWLHRFVREVVTTDPATHQPLTAIQIFLIESALECVDWEALAQSAATFARLGSCAVDPAMRAGSPVLARAGAGRFPGAFHGNDTTGGG